MPYQSEMFMLGKNTQNYDKNRQRKFIYVSYHVIYCRHAWNVLGRYLLCVNAWHFICKIFSWVYFLIKLPDVSLKHHSDLYWYRKNQDVEMQRINYLHELQAANKAYIIIITIIYHSVWSFNITFIITNAIIIIIIIIIIIVIILSSPQSLTPWIVIHHGISKRHWWWWWQQTFSHPQSSIIVSVL